MSDKEYNIRQYPLRDTIINIIINRVNEAFSGGFHKNEGKRLMDALHSIKELIPPDQFIYGGDEKWIAIADEVPNHLQKVLCYSKRYSEIFSAIFHNENNQGIFEYSDKAFYWAGTEITHWRPLPPPPQK